MESQRSALYAWGGPGTIRLLNTKYFRPTIDTHSFLTLYDRQTLDLFKERFQTTDIFVTYSWGFSDKTEREDREFLRRRLPDFRARALAPYAYVQGLNLVYPEWKHTDVFCKGPSGQVLFYSKDRAFTCPNNPRAREIIAGRVAKALEEDVAGVFLDNMLFGFPPAYIFNNTTSFFGCSCVYCQRIFRKEYGYALPLGPKTETQQIQDYIEFRTRSLFAVVQELSGLARAKKKHFGINVYDPWWHTPDYYYGFNMKEIEPLVDYVLVENLALGKHAITNGHLHQQLIHTKKPTFVVSYYQGIGREPAYTQIMYDRIYTESRHLGYIPCYKATEFTTNGVWHALRPQNYRRPTFIPLRQTYTVGRTKQLRPAVIPLRPLLSILNSLYTWMMEVVHTKQTVARVLLHSPIYTRALKKRRMYE